MIYWSLPETNREQPKSNRKACLVCCVFVSKCSMCLYVCICVLFDCKCESSKSLGENIVLFLRTKKQQTIKQKSFEKNIKTNTERNTGYPALDPTANKYLSSSGWEIMHFCCFLLLFNVFSRSFLMFVLIVVYMCFFDCNCKA